MDQHLLRDGRKCSVVFYAYLVGLEIAFSSFVVFGPCSTHALVCPRLCLSFCQFLSPSHMSVFHPFSPLILPPFSPYSSFSNFCPSDMLLVFSFPLCSLNTLKGPACPALSVVGHGLGVQRDRNPWSCNDRKGYSSEDQCFFFSAYLPKKQ